MSATLAAFGARSVAAQIAGLPVLQNAWATPGTVVALDAGSGSGGSTVAAAGSWVPGAGRFQISGGAGMHSRSGAGSAGAYGLRLAMPFGGASSDFGFAAFAGVGGTASKHVQTTLPCGLQTPGGCQPSVLDSASFSTEIPVGASVAWRHAIGATRGLSVYATPAYLWLTGGSKNSGVARVAIGADFGFTRALGATAGVDFGGSRPRVLGGPSGSQFALGVSYALGHR